MLKNNVTMEDLKEYLNLFFETYEIPSMFRYQYEQNYLNIFNDKVIDSQIAQFYKEYDLLSEEADMYKAFADIIKYKHPYLSNKTILDVGGGMIPQLGRELAAYAKHVMVIDRNMVFKNNPDNLEPIKRRIESVKDLPTADIIVGLLPCELTKQIIDYSVSKTKDFLIALCGCKHSLGLDDTTVMKLNRIWKPQNTSEKYEQYAMYRIQENTKLGDIAIYDSPYQFPNDVIGNKRR